MPFYFRLLDTPCCMLAFFHPPSLLLTVCDRARSRTRTLPHPRMPESHTRTRIILIPQAHTYVRTCNTLLLSCLSFSFHPSSLFLSVSSVSSNVVCWLQTGSWKLAIQDIDQLTRPTRPPPSILLSPSHCPCLPLFRSNSFPVFRVCLSISPFPSFSRALSAALLYNRQTVRLPDALAHCAFNKELLALVLCENSL